MEIGQVEDSPAVARTYGIKIIISTFMCEMI
jgi:hypothetical protein